MRVVEELPGCEGSFWFLFLGLEVDRIGVDKGTFVQALQAEGLPFDEGYLQHSMIFAPWYKERAVFGRSGYPWSSREYRGRANRRYELPNIFATEARHFRLYLHEKCGAREVRDTVAALRKVERVFLKIP